jgi:hypothetical protein
MKGQSRWKDEHAYNIMKEQVFQGTIKSIVALENGSKIIK